MIRSRALRTIAISQKEDRWDRYLQWITARCKLRNWEAIKVEKSFRAWRERSMSWNFLWIAKKGGFKRCKMCKWVCKTKILCLRKISVVIKTLKIVYSQHYSRCRFQRAKMLIWGKSFKKKQMDPKELMSSENTF